MFGWTGEPPKENEFEKYGYLADKDTERDFQLSGASHYGGVMIKFKRDNVFGRTTFTADDSLAPALDFDLVPSKLSSPSWTSLGQETVSGGDRKVLKALRSAYEGEVGPIDYCRQAGSLYIELQFHGELTLDDIEEVVFRPKWYGSDVKDPLKKMMDDLGIKWKDFDS